MNITVFYSCFTCGLTKRPVEVPARDREDIKQWMNATVQLLSDDHRKLNPACIPIDGKLHNIMIPIGGVRKVGGPPVQ